MSCGALPDANACPNPKLKLSDSNNEWIRGRRKSASTSKVRCPNCEKAMASSAQS